ncbi:hypothetical protein BDQ12DRAFT_642038 [Crucibulum laeve]|uniref:BTB domain-containing protein n=1 Tax=Crucibulum laeve TaxID=68775 RepID=A0A5C3MU89_9AGAR|nr:hypothetical protein BDQ12DRAFT_642038 [Crucibulum laeve]
MAVTEPAQCDKFPNPPPYRNADENSRIRRHEDYYIENGNLVIQVEDVHFKLWDHLFLRHSKFFEFNASPTSPYDEKNTNLGTDQCPLVVTGVSSIDFERLLWILCPPVIGEFKAQTLEEWISILELSTRWKFNAIRELSIRELAKIEIAPVDKVELMQTYGISLQWAYRSFIALCSRAHALDVIEGRQLGIGTTIKIAFARERLESKGRKKAEEVKKKVVCDVFELQAS